jgi:hypothetical protein
MKDPVLLLLLLSGTGAHIAAHQFAVLSRIVVFVVGIANTLMTKSFVVFFEKESSEWPFISNGCSDSSSRQKVTNGEP